MRPRAEKTYTPKRKTPADGEGLSYLLGPGGLPETGASLFRPSGLRAKGARWRMLLGWHLFEPPTSAMSRPTGRINTRVDTPKLGWKLLAVKQVAWL